MCLLRVVQPGAQFSGGAGPQRDDPLLAALAVELEGAPAFEQHVSDSQGGQLRDPGAGVVGDSQQDGVALPAPGGRSGAAKMAAICSFVR